MDSKLTLKLDRKVIENAKVYARDHGLSLSRVVESHFRGLTESDKATSAQPTGVVAELAGLLAGKEVDTSKESYARHLTRKHS